MTKREKKRIQGKGENHRHLDLDPKQEKGDSISDENGGGVWFVRATREEGGIARESYEKKTSRKNLWHGLYRKADPVGASGLFDVKVVIEEKKAAEGKRKQCSCTGGKSKGAKGS